MNADTLDVIDHALARAIVYQSLSTAFQPPTGDRVRQLGSGSGFGILRAALQHTAGRQPERRRELDAACDRLAALPEIGLCEMERQFVRLFGHTARGLVCACETEYGTGTLFNQPQQLADLAGYYLAFGLRPVTAAEARLDHIACECEFMDFLNRKEAVLLASSDDDGETLEVTRTAARTFLRDHLAQFGRAFATRLVHESRGGLYGVLGTVVLAVINVECARLGIEPGPMDLPTRPDRDDDAPMACGSGQPDLIQIVRRL